MRVRTWSTPQDRSVWFDREVKITLHRLLRMAELEKRLETNVVRTNIATVANNATVAVLAKSADTSSVAKTTVQAKVQPPPAKVKANEDTRRTFVVTAEMVERWKKGGTYSSRLEERKQELYG